MPTPPQSRLDESHFETHLFSRSGKREGDELRFLCPSHDDHHSSARFNGRKRKWYCDVCKAGGSAGGLADLLGVTIEADDRVIYDYRDASGAPLFQVIRGPHKKFSQRRPGPDGGFVWNLDGVETVLYRLPALVAADPEEWVFIAEGEKDADRLAAASLIATTNPGGAGKWAARYSQCLRGRSVVILPDNDKAGEKHAEAVARSLAGVAAHVKIVRLPNLPAKGDVSDWLDVIGDLVELRSLVEITDDWSLDARADEADDLDNGGATQASRMVSLALHGSRELWHTDTHEPFATIVVRGHHETLRLTDKAARRWLGWLFHESTKGKKTPAARSVAEALATLQAKAIYEGPEHEVSLRVARYGRAIYVDLGDADWRAIEITSQSWRVVSDPPVSFRRPRGMLALPEPAPGGKLADLRRFVNVADDADFRLLLSTLLAAFVPEGPYPILVLGGEQGSAKSTAARVCRALIDPNKAPIRAMPNDLRDLVISAGNGWVLAFDNVSHIPPRTSDALCRLATGGGFATRELYTDAEEMLFEAQRPVVLNGIEDFVVRGDLVDRSLTLLLPNIAETARVAEADFWSQFEAMRPQILGALLDAVVLALRYKDEISLAGHPRMADFARIGAAVAPALGWTSDEFLEAYGENRAAAEANVIESSPVVRATLELVDEKGAWKGTAGELLVALNDDADTELKRERSWPRSPAALANNVRRAAPTLRSMGYAVDLYRDPGTRKRERLIEIHAPKRTEPSPLSDPSVSSETVSATGISSDDSGRSDGTPSKGSSDIAGLTPDESDESDGSGGSVSALVVRPDYVLVDSPATLARALGELLTAPLIGVDTETTAAGELRLVQLAASTSSVFIFDAAACDVAPLEALFCGGVSFVFHNAKFDLQVLETAGLPWPADILDTMLAAQLLVAGAKSADIWREAPPGVAFPHASLRNVVKRYLGIEMDKRAQGADWGGPVTDDMLRYAALDAAILLPLADALETELDRAEMSQVAAIEMAALPAVVTIERNGVLIDQTSWIATAEAHEESVRTCEAELDRLMGGSAVNWNSARQVQAAFALRGLKLPDMTEASLAGCDDDLARALLTWRQAQQRVSTYGRNWLERHVNNRTGRVHPDLIQIGAATGRMAMRKPNLQNIPREEAFRRCVVASSGNVLIKADYSQIELRVLAVVAEDDVMLDAYRRGEDLHERTAMETLNEIEDRKQARQTAKAINFAMAYGGTEDALRQIAYQYYGVVLTGKDARRFRNRWRRTYAGVSRWQDTQARGKRDTRTLAGRRRIGVTSFTEKLNTPIQGTAADGFKRSLGFLYERREQAPTAKLVLVVHDEIVVECPIEDAPTTANWLRECMVAGMEEVLRNAVPVVVDVEVGPNWSDCSPFDAWPAKDGEPPSDGLS